MLIRGALTLQGTSYLGAVCETRLPLQARGKSCGIFEKGQSNLNQLGKTKSGQLITPGDRKRRYCVLALLFMICCFGGSGARLLVLILAVIMWAT